MTSALDFEPLINELEVRWGLRDGELTTAGQNAHILHYKTAVELIQRLLPLNVTSSSCNEPDENDSIDPSTYDNGGILMDVLRDTGGTDATLTHVHNDLVEARKRRLSEYGELLCKMDRMVNEDTHTHQDINEDDMRRVSRMLEILYYAENIQTGIRHLMHLFSTGIEGMRNIPGATSSVQTFGKRFKREADEKDKKPPQMQLSLSMLRELSLQGFRRYRDNVMKPVVINGQYTYSWVKHSSIEAFVWDHINSHMHADNFANAMNGKGTISYVIEYLKKCCQHEFPDLIKERRIHAFRNGIYITSVADEAGVFQRKSHVIFYDQQPDRDEILIRMTRQGKVAACFHDCDLPRERDEAGNLQPNAVTFEKISTHQRWTEDVKEWFRAACGRMLHPIGSTPSPLTLEKWQIFWLLLGVGNSGKSTTIDNVIYNFFDPEDVVYIQNNLEKQYGWSKCKGRYMWLAPEIKSDFAEHCDQAQFQQVVEGGRLASAKKYAIETVEFDPFDLPGMMGANESIDFHDNGESVSRRRVDFWFGQPILSVDPSMPEALKRELGHIIYLCNEAYLRKTIEVKARIWDHLPHYFIELRKENAAATNALEHFLQNGRLEYHPDFYISQSEFQHIFTNHCKSNELKNKRTFKKEYFQGPFQKRDINVEKSQRHCPVENKMCTKVWILGVREMREDAFY